MFARGTCALWSSSYQANYGEYRPSVMQVRTKALDLVHGPHLVWVLQIEIGKCLI